MIAASEKLLQHLDADTTVAAGRKDALRQTARKRMGLKND